MDTSESQSDKAATPAPAGAPVTATPAPAPAAPAPDNVNQADVANMMAMGFPREVCIEELKRNNGDVNLAVAAIFAKSLSDSFAKKK